ncbi:phage holin family protein [Changchengzhania lutea]|uniref:phage holin family protein n=1 Tax=Changchengzhania lutea TaxID=2049305 RepID=UPI00115D32CD|nr:phage holin family protein [Changchengzhania lutea]
MSILESLNDNTAKASDVGEKFIKTSHQYYKLKIFQQLTISLSLMTKVFVIGGFFIIGLMFLSIASAIAIGNALNNLPLGYVIVGVVFLIIAFVIHYKRDFIDRRVIQEISKKFFN